MILNDCQDMIVLVFRVDGVGSCGVGAVPTVETVSICVQTSSLPIMIEFLCVGHVGPRALLHVPHTWCAIDLFLPSYIPVHEGF